MDATSGSKSAGDTLRRKRVPLHPVLAAIPIGSWVASLVFDVASYIAAEPRFLAEGSRWLIVIGLIAAAPTAITGLIDALPVPPRTAAAQVVMWHMGLMMAAWLLYATNFLLRTGTVDAPVPAGLVGLSGAGVVVLGAAALAGSSLAHRHTPPAAGHSTR